MMGKRAGKERVEGSGLREESGIGVAEGRRLLRERRQGATVGIWSRGDEQVGTEILGSATIFAV